LTDEDEPSAGSGLDFLVPERELRWLRRELKSRIDRYPAGTWSASLLMAMISVMDLSLEGRDSGSEGRSDFSGRPRLTVVGNG